MILDASATDNINNFTKAGKASKSDADNAATALFNNTQDFIKLLTVQLQNQDPTKPLETDQITQQIASLSQVEQQINTNKNLEKLMASFIQSQTSDMVSYIGKSIEAPGNLGYLNGGQATFVYSLASAAKESKLTITDPTGNVVYEGDGTTLAGRNTFNWNGRNNYGERVAEGVYQISVRAKDELGKIVPSNTSSFGRVTSVETLEGINYLALGDILVPLDKVISVRG